MTLAEICEDIKNYFLAHKEDDIHSGEYKIENGGIASLDFLKEGQYFRIVGSALNDGVYKYPADDLKDEEFEGSIWAMSVPPTFVALAEEIIDWVETNGKALAGPYTSESFAGYSYTKASTKSGSGGAFTWVDQFATRLTPYRRMYLP